MDASMVGDGTMIRTGRLAAEVGPPHLFRWDKKCKYHLAITPWR